MTMPSRSELTRVFDFRINLVAILALGGMIFGAAAGYSKMESKEQHQVDIQKVTEDRQNDTERTRQSHRADMDHIEASFVRKDVSDEKFNDLRDRLERIEQKLDLAARVGTRARE